MYSDSRGLVITASHSSSVERFDSAVSRYLGARKDTPDHVGVLIADDPRCVLAWCLQGYLLLHAGKPECHARAREVHLRAAWAASGDITPRESLHLGALQAWIAGDFAGVEMAAIVEVGCGDAFGSGDGDRGREEVGALHADSDDPEADAVGGLRRGRGFQQNGVRGGEAGGGLKESTSGVHFFMG